MFARLRGELQLAAGIAGQQIQRAQYRKQHDGGPLGEAASGAQSFEGARSVSKLFKNIEVRHGCGQQLRGEIAAKRVEYRRRISPRKTQSRALHIHGSIHMFTTIHR
jgi:hypothetical protein